MNKYFSALIFAGGVLAVGNAALAADTAKPAPAVKPVAVPAAPKAYNWAGLYIGVQGGWDSNVVTINNPKGFSGTVAGGIWGVYGGFNIAHGPKWIVGFDGSYNWDNATGTFNIDAAKPTPHTADVDIASKALLRARVGIPQDNHLLYFDAGAAEATGSANGSPSTTQWGWTVGAGLDWVLHTNSNFIGRLDWSYQNYGEQHVNGGNSSATGNTYTAGIAIKFH